MNTYLTLFIIATCAALSLTPIIRRICERYKLLDQAQDERRVHHRPVPRLGGVAIYLSLLVALAFLPFIDNLVTQTLRANLSNLLTALVPATLMLLVGVYDDLKGTKARFKFIMQGLAGALFYAMGGRIEYVSIPYYGSLELPFVIGFAATLFWVIAITNAFNLIDGVDGLAAGAALFASLVILVVSFLTEQPLVTVIALILSGALIGFLRYNFNPASIFLGDSGALFVGFMLAALSVLGPQKASTAVAVAIPILTFGVPVIDTGFTLVRRFISRKPLFEGDREHIHHMLLERGWSQRRVALVLYGASALFGLLALLFFSSMEGRTTGLMLFVVGAAVIFAVGRLRYHEVDEVRASMRRNLAERRVRAANNIRVRRASRAMSRAGSFKEIFSVIDQLLEFDEFVYATVQIDVGNGACYEQALELEKDHSVSGVGVRGQTICWSWERGDVSAAEVVGSSRFWTLRLPLGTQRCELGAINLYREVGSDPLLLDINYLCNLFQREATRAVERALSAGEQSPAHGSLLVSATRGN